MKQSTHLCSYCGGTTDYSHEGICARCSWRVHEDVARGLAEIERYVGLWASAEDWALQHGRSVV